MKKILFLFGIFISQLSLAQFTTEDVKYFVGEGNQTAYLVVDFKDGTDDRSYAWGFRFDETESLSFEDMLNTIDLEEPQFSIQADGGFLNDIVFNTHSGISGSPDWWSTWSGESSESMSMNSGISEELIDNRWYGVSYGFSNPAPEHPIQPIPAYHSLWFSENDMINWFGEGSNKSIVVIDFGTETDGIANSFAFGIQFNDPISVSAIFELLSSKVADFDFEINENLISEISWNNHQGIATEGNQWKTYSGTNLSDWKTELDWTTISLENNQWLGLSFGDRRPFIPTDKSELLHNVEYTQNEFSIYPNPTSNYFYVNGDGVSAVEIYDLSGRLLKTNTNLKNGTSVQGLSKGIYLVKILSESGVTTRSIVVK